MNIKAMILDLDGTLFNTSEDLCDSFNKAAAIYGYPPRGVKEFLMFVGSGARNIVKKGLPEGVPDDIYEKVFVDYNRIYSENLTTKTRPYDGIPEVLEEFVKAGVKLSVMSNKPDPHTKLIVRELLPKIPFVVVYGNKEGRPHKPDPEVPLEVASIMGTAPADIAFVGDSDVDMKTGVNAKMIAVGCTWGFRDREVIAAAGAAYLMDSPRDLLDLLK